VNLAVSAPAKVLARWAPAYVGLGSNLDDPIQQVRTAFDRLAKVPRSRLLLRSSLYRTKPFGAVVQPAFINAVAGLLTQLTPEEMLAELRAIELTMGRAPPRERWGPRRIDLDLLVLGAEERATAELTLPHPGIAERDFVLLPFDEVAAEARVPRLGRVRALRERVNLRGIEQLGAEWSAP
jgi:2-amino-4-hydroxy-6-hydroxymethyldihydropteridine diphosphokinase